jgi:hypothetical protein
MRKCVPGFCLLFVMSALYLHATVSVSVYPASAAIPAGGTVRFQATIGGSTNTTVTWYVDGISAGNVSVGQIDANGNYLAPPSPGTHRIKAISAADTTKSASAPATVYSSITVDFASRSGNTSTVSANLFGAQDSYFNDWANASLMTKWGVNGTRLYANLPVVYATQTPDWTKIDPTLQLISIAGMHPIIEMAFTPPWLQPSTTTCTDKTKTPPTDVNAWANIAAAFVTHVNTAFPGLVTDYEIWNEPDNLTFLCTSTNTDAARQSAYLGIFAAAAPAMRAAGNGVIHIGGPVIGRPDLHMSWMRALVTNASTAPFVDFLSYHSYFGYNSNLTWNSGTDNVYSRTQGSARGVMPIYAQVSKALSTGATSGGANTPIYITEYDTTSDSKVDCCRSSAQYAPVWNALFVSDLLNSVYGGAAHVANRLNYYAINNRYAQACLFGIIDANMDCAYPTAGTPPSPYPQLQAYHLMAGSDLLGLSGGANLAASVSPPVTMNGIVVAGFYNASDNVLIVNPTATALSQVPVQILNTGYATANATEYLLNASNPNISTQSLGLTASGPGAVASVDLPAYSVVALKISAGSSVGISISISPVSASINAGSSQAFTAVVSGTTNQSVTWSVDSVVGGSLSSGTVDANGNYTAPAASGQHMVAVTSKADTTQSAIANIKVLSTTSVTIAPSLASVPAASTITFSATVSGNPNTSLTWLVDGIVGGSTTVGTMSSGLYTAPANAGTHNVTAQSIGDPSASATAQVTVTPVTIVTVKPRATAVTFTQVVRFMASVTGTTNAAVMWAVDGMTGGNSTVGTIDTTGLYTPPATTGVHTITATSLADMTKSAIAQLTITNYAGVFTYHFDKARTGANTQETVLSPSNVNANQFGKLFSYATDGWVIGNPLYVANVNIVGVGYHNMLFAATSHDSVYAWDADGLSTQPLWQVSFINPANGVTTVPLSDIGGKAPGGEVGIASTPVIDPSTNTMYVLAQTKENGSFIHRLHALDITTGQERFNSPVAINATVPGTGDDTDGNGNVPFISQHHYQRPALMLNNGNVYVCFGSHYDLRPYHGWVMVYNASTLQRVSVINVTPNGNEGGVWQSGGGPSADNNGNVFVPIANGTFDASTGGSDYGDTVLKLSVGPQGLSVTDWFTPYNQAYLQSTDLDLGSSDAIVLPDEAGSSTHPHLLLTAGKQARIYLLDRDNLGHYRTTSDSQIVQSVSGQLSTSEFISTPAYWNHYVYFQSWNDVLKAFSINGGALSSTPVSKGGTQFGWPGAPPVVSANGNANGIVWVFQRGPGTLRAYSATNLTNQLFTATGLGVEVPFATPIVANGKVYIGTTNQVVGYGLLP